MTKKINEALIKESLKEFFDPSSVRMKTLSRYTVDPWVLLYQTNPMTDRNTPFDSLLNNDIIPQNKRELEVSLKNLFSDIDDTDAPELFKKIKDSIDDYLDNEDQNQMKENVRSKARKIISEGVEADTLEMKKVRMMVRKMVNEAISSVGLSNIDYFGDGDDEDERKPKGKQARTVGDVGGDAWDKLKAVSGHKGKGTSGIEQYVYGKPREPGGAPVGGLVQRFANIISAGAPSVQDYVDNQTKKSRSGEADRGRQQMMRGEVIRNLVDEYVGYLQSSEVLDDEEVEFMRDNPDAVETMPLFKSMLKKSIDRLDGKKDKSEDEKFLVKDLNAYLRDLEKFE